MATDSNNLIAQQPCMTVAGAAKFLRTRKAAVLQMIHDGRIPVINVGTVCRPRYRLVLAQLVAALEVRPDPKPTPKRPTKKTSGFIEKW